MLFQLILSDICILSFRIKQEEQLDDPYIFLWGKRKSYGPCHLKAFLGAEVLSRPCQRRTCSTSLSLLFRVAGSDGSSACQRGGKRTRPCIWFKRICMDMRSHSFLILSPFVWHVLTSQVPTSSQRPSVLPIHVPVVHQFDVCHSLYVQGDRLSGNTSSRARHLKRIF